MNSKLLQNVDKMMNKFGSRVWSHVWEKFFCLKHQVVMMYEFLFAKVGLWVTMTMVCPCSTLFLCRVMIASCHADSFLRRDFEMYASDFCCPFQHTLGKWNFKCGAHCIQRLHKVFNSNLSSEMSCYSFHWNYFLSALWIIQSNGDTISGTLLLNVLNVIFQHHTQNTIYLHCTGLATEISVTSV